MTTMDRFAQRARQLRAAQTSAEQRLWQALRNRKLGERKFRRQWPIDGYVVDFVCLGAKLAAEVDGATHCSEADIVRDAERTRVLERLGFQVMRVQNAEIYQSLPGVLETILAELEHRVHL
jgi:very-short-patch-repair endonuclease